MKTLFLLSGLVLSLGAQAKGFGPGAGKNYSSLNDALLMVDGAGAVQGSEFNLFIRPATGYANSYVVVDAALDGTPVSLEHPTKDLWIYNYPEFEGLRQHTLTFNVSLEGSRETDQINQSLCQVDSEIMDLQNQILNTTDPNALDRLNQLLAQNQALKAQLQADLTNLKNFIGQQTYSFSVAPAPSDSAVFPHVTSVGPNVGPVAGGTAVTILGANFTTGAGVTIGGVAATDVTVVDANTITAVTPALSAGVQDVMVTLPLVAGDVEQKQALLTNGFFASASRVLDAKRLSGVSVLDYQEGNPDSPYCTWGE